MSDVPLGYITMAEARRLTGLTRQRIAKLCEAGKVRRKLATDHPRWLYNRADLVEHLRTRKPGPPFQDRE